MAIKDLFTRNNRFSQHLLAFEWVGLGYTIITLIIIALHSPKIVNFESMMTLRALYVVVTLGAWLLYFRLPCRFTLLLRVIIQMVFLSWWYPDTYELNRILPNLDYLFAACEQAVFSCQPSLLFSQWVPWGWFSELMCLGYISYFPLMTLLLLYYFFRRYDELPMAAFVILASFFTYYVIFIFLPVTGPQFYYLAVGTDNIAQGIFPNITDWFLTHSERMAAPGWSDGFFYHLLDITHDAGERPTAAFPSSHVGITTVVMLLALRTRCRWLTLVILPFYVLMCFSTVYIYAHYAIDAIAGLITGVLFYYISLRIYKFI